MPYTLPLVVQLLNLAMASFTEVQPSPNYILATDHEEMNAKRRNTMEDVHRIVPALDINHDILKNVSYFGIYDGHGGRQIVDYLENALENQIAEELKLTDDASIGERLAR